MKKENDFKGLYRVASAMVLLCMPLLCHTQERVINLTNNSPQAESIVKKQLLPYVYEGQGGENQLWDFTGLDTRESYSISYKQRGDTLLGLDEQKAYYYSLKEYGLWLAGYENPLEKMEYSKLKPTMLLPLSYGEVRSCDYAGHGHYCGTHFIREHGICQQKADGFGRLILSESDTLFNALRVQTITTTALRISRDSLANDNDNQKQIVTESYQWYVPGYRHPVFETVSSTTYHDLKPVATRQYALRCMPDRQFPSSDSINLEMRRKQDSTTFTYEVRNVQNRVTISYDLAADATLRVIVADAMGVLYRSQEESRPAGQGYMLTIDCNGLRHGQYVVYMNVNGNVYNHKISVK